MPITQLLKKRYPSLRRWKPRNLAIVVILVASPILTILTAGAIAVLLRHRNAHAAETPGEKAGLFNNAANFLHIGMLVTDIVTFPKVLLEIDALPKGLLRR